MQYMAEQDFISRSIPIEDLFVTLPDGAGAEFCFL